MRKEDLVFKKDMSLPIHMVTYLERPRLVSVAHYLKSKNEWKDQGDIPDFARSSTSPLTEKEKKWFKKLLCNTFEAHYE